MPLPPSGTVTFLFTDIEGSTRRWEDDADQMRGALAAHDETLRSEIESRGGLLFKHTGDGVCAAFVSPNGAVAAAVAAQLALGLPVRMGIATGEAERRGDDYFGPILNRAARIMAAGHGGQILVAASTAALVEGVDLVDLGERRLKDLSEPVAIYQVAAPGLLADLPALRTLDVVPGNLPVQATSFVGRESEIAALEASLGANRMVTLVGVGGIGKTRLALQAAAGLSDRHRDGTWLVELAPILDGGLVTEAVASIFSVPPNAATSWLDLLTEALRARQLLLVLDNCEHVLDEAAALAEQIIARCPEVTVLATSREALSIAGEVTTRVASLDVGASAAAAQLFAARAQAVAADVDPGADAEVIAEICRRLDGIPLAIELAASRVRSMSPEQIRDRLDERFRLLTGARRSTERHQTLRQAVQWSYDLLDATEQGVLQRASVFAGGFILADASAVCDTGHEGRSDELGMLDVLDSLVRKSLLQVERSGRNIRYTLLETIRQFAEERMAERNEGDAVRDRHAAWFADRAEQAFADFRSPREALAYAFVDCEIANLRAAYNWERGREDPEPAIRIAACTHEIARFRLRTETFAWPAEMVEPATRSSHRMLPLLLTMACDSAWSLGALDDADRYGNDAIQANEDPRFEPFVWAYTDLAQVALFGGDVAGALSLARAGAAHPVDAHDHFVLGFELVVRGLVGEPVVGTELDAAVARINERGVPMAVALGLAAQAGALADAGKGEGLVIAKLEQAINLLESTGNRFLAETLRTRLLIRLAAAQDPRLALEGFAEIVNVWQVNGDTAFAGGMGHLIALLIRLRDLEGGARLYGAVVRTVTLGTLVPELAPAIDAARAQLGGDRFDRLASEGSELSYQAAGDLARDRIRSALATC